MSVRQEGGEGNLRDVLLMSHWCRCAKRYVTGQEDLRLGRKQTKLTINVKELVFIFASVFV